MMSVDQSAVEMDASSEEGLSFDVEKLKREAQMRSSDEKLK